MKRFGILAVFLASACGDDASKTPSIEGSWYLSSSAKECDLGLVFDGENFEADTICTLNSGQVAVEAYAGTYVAANGQLTTATTHSSCAGTSRDEATESYDFIDGKLRIASPDGVLIFERLPDSDTSNGAFAYGCFDDQGVFSASPVKPL